MNRVCILGIVLVTCMARVSAQETVTPTHGSRPRPFLRQPITNKGLKVNIERRELRRAEPMTFAVPDLKADTLPSRNQLDALQQRVSALQDLVNKAMEPENGEAHSSEKVIERLRDARTRAADVLKRDLGNLLIAGMVTAERRGIGPDQKPYSDRTWVWSYRRLDKQEDWGPVIELEPNSVLMIPVLNLLDKAELQARTVPDFAIVDPVRSGPSANSPMNGPNGFDIVNLHTHGLNVSPNFPADNIFREIHPRQLKFYFYQIPSDQTPGTYFYHPHRHGAVATQVAGGMAGALIVRDEKHGLDELGKRSGWNRDTEATLMIQQFQLYKRDEDASDRFTRPDFFAIKDVDISRGVLCHERPDIQKLSQRIAGDKTQNIKPIARLPIETWVSGMFQPRIAGGFALGEIRRFRLIHAGVEKDVDFAVRTTRADAPEAILQVIAFDGIPLKQPYFLSEEQRLILSPGNRADVLVYIPSVLGSISYSENLTYSVVDRGDPASDLLLATFEVAPDKKLNEVARIVSQSDANAIYTNCAPQVSKPEVPNLEAFDLSFADAAIDDQGKYTPGTFQINRDAFPGVPKVFRLGHSQRLAFAVPGGDSPHPLHIHVNPFLVPADQSRGRQGLPVCEFWADTLLIWPSSDGHPDPSVNVVMPFHHWTGDFVSHCHILDHEDAGMMSLVRIRPAACSWPEFSPVSALDEPRLPDAAVKRLRATWPKEGSVPASVDGKVSVYFFMPSEEDGSACPHCTDSVRAVAGFRQELKKPELVRVVIVSATPPDAMPDPATMGLLKEHDVLCSDPELRAFEPLWLLDGTPVVADDGDITFPNVFQPHTRQPIWPMDVMHGLFIVDHNGMLMSARRGFSAFDDAWQIMHEVELVAAGPEAILTAYRDARDADMAPATRRRLELHESRFQNRLESFQAK